MKKSKNNDFELLSDWLKNLIERAIAVEVEKGAFYEGIQQGYYEAISHLLLQLDAFDLIKELNDKYLEEFESESIITGTAKHLFK